MRPACGRESPNPVIAYTAYVWYHAVHHMVTKKTGRFTPETLAETGTVVKTTVNLPANVVESLRKLAASRGTSMGKVIADAIELEAYVQERRQRGARVLVEQEDKTLTELFLR